MNGDTLLPDYSDEYADIIHLPHRVSTRHPSMSLSDRAAQFLPFSALSGFEDAIDETARLTEERPVLDDSEKERISSLLTRASLDPSFILSVAYFLPDPLKPGGSFALAIGSVRRLDRLSRTLTLKSAATPIPIDDIICVLPHSHNRSGEEMSRSST
ncbi:MAG: hypothetical protein PUD60_06585 [Akkermansia muciniphila]|nr:hypothetical protein [Akkermansia muciniphila]